LESLIDSYYPGGQIFFGIKSPASVVEIIFWRYRLSVEKKNQTKIYFCYHTTID
jgi:hypothetical protein